MTKQQIYLVASLCYIILFSVVNNTMFNVSLPTLAQEFELTPALVSWVMIGYGIVFAIGSVMYGKLADLFPVRRLIIIGLLLFSSGSVIGFFAPNYGVLITGRVVQGAGASAIPALSMIVATRYFPVNMRGRIFGFVASTVAFGMGVGPILGGAIAAMYGWKALFLFSIGSLLGLPFMGKHLPEDATAEGSLDVIGAVLFGVGSAALFMGVNLNSYLLLVAGVFLGLFFWRIRRVNNPFVRFDLLREPRYRLLLALGFSIFCTIGAFFFTIPIMLEAVHGSTAGGIGLVMFPGAMTSALLGSYVGRLSDRHGSPLIILCSAIMMLVGYALLSSLLHTSLWLVSMIMVAVYLGFSSLSTALGSYIPTTLAKEEVGIGTGLYNLINFMGSSMGTAWSSRLFESEPGRCNPFFKGSHPAFSNAFLLMLALVSLGLWFLYREQKKKESSASAANDERALAE